MDRRPTRLNGVGSERSGLQRAESLTTTQDNPTPPNDRGLWASLNRPWKEGTVHRASVVARLVHNRRRVGYPAMRSGEDPSPLERPRRSRHRSPALSLHCL